MFFIYRREIDGLRALAVVPVILFHGGFEAFSGGFVGVDVFFVISGYLITSIILAQRETDSFSLIKFYVRRASRLLPPLFLVMAFCIPLAWLWLPPSDMQAFSKSLIAVSVFASNILFWREGEYFDISAELKPLLHTWSLAVEGQFYVLFPLFLFVMWRFAKRWTVATLAVIAALSYALAQWGAYNSPVGAFFLLPTRGWEIAIGAIVAFYFARYPKLQLQRTVQEVGGLVGLWLILFAVFSYSKATPYPSAYALVPTFGAALIILCTTPATVLGRLLTSKAFVGIGLISYSTYLWHQPLLAFTRINYGHIGVLGVTSILALTLIFAYVTYRYIELPFRKIQNINSKITISLLVTLSFFFFSFGLFGYFTKGIEKRFSHDELTIYRTLERSMEANCSDSISECIVKAGEAPSILLLGDSNAYHFSRSLKEISSEIGLNYYQLTKGGCLPLANFYRLDQYEKFNVDCIGFNSTVRQAIFEEKRKIEVIVVSAAWLLYLEGEEYFKTQILEKRGAALSKVKLSRDGVASLSQSDRVESFDKYMFEMLSLLAARSKKLIVVGPIPPLPTNFSSMKNLVDLQGVAAHEFMVSSFNFDKIINKYDTIKFSYIDISKSMCVQEICVARDLYGIFYFDSTHLTDHGQRMIVKPLLMRSFSEK